MNTEILFNLLIDANGMLREQHQGDKERTLCHTARMRNEYQYADTLIQFATRLTLDQRQQFAQEKFVQWVTWYLKPEYDLPEDSEQFHYDVSQITDSLSLQQWWWSEWRDYDLHLSQWLIDAYSKELEHISKHQPAAIARTLALQKAVNEYFFAHDQKFNLSTKQFAQIELSYCQAISKAN